MNRLHVTAPRAAVLIRDAPKAAGLLQFGIQAAIGTSDAVLMLVEPATQNAAQAQTRATSAEQVNSP